jgi:PAS domain S-box-containing protein
MANCLPQSSKIVIALMVTVSIGTASLAFWMAKEELIERAGEGLASRAANVADKLDLILSERLGDIQTFASSPRLWDPEPATVAAYLQDLKQVYPVYARIALAHADGRILATTDAALTERDVHHASWFVRTVQGRRPDIELILPGQGAPAGVAVLRYAARVNDPGGKLTGIIWTEVDRHTLRSLVAETIRTKHSSSLPRLREQFRVLGSQGEVLLTSEAALEIPDSPSPDGDDTVALFVDHEMGYVDTIDHRTGQPVLRGYARMQGVPQAEGTRWNILVEVDRRTVLASTWETLWKLVGIAAAAILPLLGLLVWARQRQTEDERTVSAAHMALEANEARIRTILDHALDAVISIDATGMVMEWNPQAEQTFGFTKQEAVGHMLHALIIPEASREAHQRGLLRYMHSGQHAILNRRIEITALHKDGHEFPVELTVIPLRIGDSVSFCAFLRDITQQKRDEQDLKDSKMFLGSIVENLPMMVFVKEAQDLRFVRVNKAGEDLIGVREAELTGLNDYDFFPKEQADSFTGKDREVLRSGCLQDVPEELIQTKHRGQRILHTKKIPLFDSAGRPQYLLGISEDITERKQAEEALRHSQQAAESANRAKTEFLANVSHEIRTPLNATLGMLELLAESTLTPDQREYTQIGQRAGRALLDLVNDLLDMAKAEAGTLQLDSEPFNIREFLVKTQAMIRPRAHDKGLHLGLMVFEEVPTHIEGDARRVRQILLNLMGNAIKFTADGHVTLSVSLVSPQDSNPSFIRFAVTDSGIGIRPEQQDRIFDRFTQIESGDNRKYGGTGLGLPISRQIAQLMGGSIRVESQLGLGSTFVFTMPYHAGASAEPPVLPALGGTLPSTAAPRRASLVRPLKILAVDDFPETLQLVKAYLRQSPYRLDVIDGGEEALRCHQARRYDLILMDMQMPGMDGYAVVRAIRAAEQAQGQAPVPVIAMTADVSDSARARSTACGCTAFLGKPFTKALLLEMIQQYAGALQDNRTTEPILPASPAGPLDPDLQTLRRAFLQNRLEDIHLLSAALERSDFETIHTIGHRIKGLAGSYGLTEIGAVGASLEQAAGQSDHTTVRGQIERLSQLLAQCTAPAGLRAT